MASLPSLGRSILVVRKGKSSLIGFTLVVRARSTVSWIMVSALTAGQVAPAFADQALSKTEYEACQAREEPAFRAAIEAISARALKTGIANVDFRAIVGDEWRGGGLDEIVDKRVDLAVEEIRQETSWANLLESLASQQKAQQLATAVAEHVYRSDAMKAALETLAVGVGRQVGKQIQFATEDAAEPTLACLKAFVGSRYGTTVARAVAGDANKEGAFNPDNAAAEIRPGAVLRQSGAGIAGAAILLMRRQLANMARRVGQRIVGAVLARLVSVVAGGVGLVLIAKDIWDLRHGVLPIIATEMKSKDSKEKVQDELAITFEEQISAHVNEIAAATADRVIDIWRQFRSAHAQALELAARNDQFKNFIDTQPPKKLARLDEVVSLVITSEGESGLLTRLNNGTLNEAVNELPPPAMQIARETRSIDAGLAWYALAGDQLGQVVDLDIYRRTTPNKLSKASLQRILSLDDRLAITRLVGIDRDARETLFELPPAELTSLARSLTEDELVTLARYLTGLRKEPRERVLRAVATDPTKMHSLASERVRVAVVTSADQSAAVTMMLRQDTVLNPKAIIEDVGLVTGGHVSPFLLWEKHPVLIVAGLVVALILLLMLRRLLFSGRRSTPAT